MNCASGTLEVPTSLGLVKYSGPLGSVGHVGLNR